MGSSCLVHCTVWAILEIQGLAHSLWPLTKKTKQNKTTTQKTNVNEKTASPNLCDTEEEILRR